MDKENFIIKAFLSDNDINGDDGAVLKMFGKWCFSKDLFFEDVHFRREWLSFKQIAAKALLVNISDAIVMNAVPKYALLGLALPKDISNTDIKALQRGFLKTASDFGIKIIGGDTISADKIAISVTLISKVRKKAIFRKGLKKGDLLAFTGTLGEGLRGLKALQKGENLVNSVNLRDLKGLKSDKNSQNTAKLPPTQRFIKPTLRGEFFYKIAPKVRCAMDISDGLGQDLARMLDLNNLGVNFLRNLSEFELNSGEEYELLFAFVPKHKDFILKTAQKFGVKLTIFGKAKPIKSPKDTYKFKGRSWHF